MAKINRFRKFELITGFVAIAFLIGIPTAAVLCVKTFIFDSGFFEDVANYIWILTVIGVGVYIILSILSNIYIIVKMFGSSLSDRTNSFFLTLIMIFSGFVPGIMTFIAKHHTSSDNVSVGHKMIDEDYDDEDPEEKRKRKQEEKEKKNAEERRHLRRAGKLTDLLEEE